MRDSDHLEYAAETLERLAAAERATGTSRRHAARWSKASDWRAVRQGDRPITATLRQGFAALALDLREFPRAAVLVGAAGRLFESDALAAPYPEEFDRVTEETRAALGEPSFAAGSAAGRSMTFDEAVDYPLGEGVEPPASKHAADGAATEEAHAEIARARAREETNAR